MPKGQTGGSSRRPSRPSAWGQSRLLTKEKRENSFFISFCTPEDSLAAEPVRIIFAVSFEAPTSDLVGLIEQRKLAICP